MKIIGAHLSISDGIYKLENKMKLLGADTCAMFLKSKLRHHSSPFDKKDVKLFRSIVKNPELLLPHCPYIINLLNNKNGASFDNLVDNMYRCKQLGIQYLNLHPGSDTQKLGSEVYKILGDLINKAHKKVDDVVICLENMAGQGRVICVEFEDYPKIFEHVKDKSRIGVVLDTAHLHGAGHDIRTEEKFKSVMKKFDEIVGMEYLKGMHLNDSKVKLGSKKDRHESLGAGTLGLEPFKFIMNSELFENIPMILETPDPNLYKSEIELLRSLIRK
ncbi:END4 [Hepatospora eriocheir]|uniref:Apurinic-apyrimidinic endonuclease 1 n=1 Tax=Hepatospora eriocheir TaxID=1081669 RepID=A0A1X0QF61_9MICR|nr:END4 [Hepatospora eriocheir]